MKDEMKTKAKKMNVKYRRRAKRKMVSKEEAVKLIEKDEDEAGE